MTTPDNPPKTPRHNCVPLEIRSKIQEKILRRVWHCGRHNEDKKALSKAIVVLKELINNAKNSTLTLHLESLTATKSTNYSLWKATSNFNQPKRTRPPLRLADAKWARTAQQRVDAFANHLAEVFKPNDGTSNEDLNIEVESSLPSLPGAAGSSGAGSGSGSSSEDSASHASFTDSLSDSFLASGFGGSF
ncbi:Uncharacterized protein OBRU01_03928 [Operophtera brumata]|uniref:Uncharacterized protein n=1 Tax=Operophtera brumata TaxID=104452 RepID=A0A0L7LPX9_OPEBR|nr:Uncharacterized protein OBRU01_03928 [Operophtera brumata]